MADRTTGELDPVKESPIGGLPEILALYDDTLLPVEQQGAAMRMTGRQFRQFGEKTAEIYVQTAVDASNSAKTDADRAQEMRQSIQMDYEYIDTARQEAQESAAAAGKSEAAAEDWSNTSKSWAIGEGLGEKRPDEGTDNAKYYAGQAQGSAESAAGSVKVVEENADVLRTVQDNLEGILAAPDAADRAEAAADSAEFDAQRAEEAANRAQSIAQGAKGYYATAEGLRKALPQGQDGEWAIVGETDTIWVWDSDSGNWKDSHQATDLSNYYTKDQADEENNKLLAQITQETDGKLAEKLGKTEAAARVAQPLSFTGGVSDSYDGSEAKSVAIPAASTTTPIAAGAASAGKEAAFARGDHVHPAQTSVTGNAGTASKLSPGATINGVLYDGSKPITIKPKYTMIGVANNPGTKGTITLSSAPNNFDELEITFWCRWSTDTNPNWFEFSRRVWVAGLDADIMYSVGYYCDKNNFIWPRFYVVNKAATTFNHTTEMSNSAWAVKQIRVVGISY